MRAVSIVSVAFVVSRLLGFVRGAIILAIYSVDTIDVNAYEIATRFPDAIFYIIAGGALGSAFIPTFSAYFVADDRPGGWRLFSAIINLVLVVLVIVCALVAVFAEQFLLWLYAPIMTAQPALLPLTADLMQVMLLSTIIFGISGVFMAALNARQHFVLPAVAPIIYNVGIILGTILWAPNIMGVAIGTVAGAAGQNFGRIKDPELELACVRAYNDWLLDEWSSVSERFIPQCITPLFPVDAAVKEIRRAVGNGHRGVIYPAVPMELRDVPHINDSVYDPLWKVCCELNVPICFHAGSSAAIQVPPYEGYSPTVAAAFQSITRPVSTVSVLVNLLISKILLRFPELKVVLGESGLGWGAYLLEYTDFQAKGDQLPTHGYDLSPSEMFKRQCFLVGWYDQASIKTRDYIGTQNILWSSQFPLATSTWPDSRKFIGKSFAGVPESDRKKILCENAARLYKIRIASENN